MSKDDEYDYLFKGTWTTVCTYANTIKWGLYDYTNQPPGAQGKGLFIGEPYYYSSPTGVLSGVEPLWIQSYAI